MTIQSYTKRVRHVHILALYFSLVTSFCFGFIVRPQPPRVKTSFVQRSYKENGIPSEPIFHDIRVNGTAAVPDDVPKDVGQKKVQETLYKEQTLYEILGASKNATRAELKQCYVKLAKVTHPDAMIGGKNDATSNDPNHPDFGDIAAAWRVLGDSKLRKRYDRDLKAKEFSEYAQRFANERLEKAVPAVAEMMDKIAVPFLKKTTATTWAVGRAVARGVSGFSNGTEKSNSNVITDAFMDAVKAGQDASRAIDTMELKEKSKELDQRVKAEQEKAVALEKELENVKERRLFATLNSPDYALLSTQAKEMVDILENEKSVNGQAQVGGLYRKKVVQEITYLEQAEENFSNKLGEYDQTDREWQNLLREAESAKRNLTARKEQEIEARKALERARRMVTEAKAHLITTTNALKSVEQRVRRNAQEMERVTNVLSKSQEKVRVALRQKVGMLESGHRVEYINSPDFEQLRQQEIKLMGETEEVARIVARLESRAEKLRLRAEALERWQQSNGFSEGTALREKAP